MAEPMSAEQAAMLCDLLARNGIRCWVMGGWGVDALLGRVTRVHKDLDLLVLVADLPRYTSVVRAAGFDRKLEWSENQPIYVARRMYDSAFVDAHPDGREMDVHVVDVDGVRSAVQLHSDPWPLPPGALSGRGVIAGKEVRCVSPGAQLAMHTNYRLPHEHREDVRLLRAKGLSR